jgi:N,N'-diacetyllegionaminate synthase
MKKVVIIAEAGVNHNGDVILAKKLIDVACDAGVDYVKFQTFVAENLVSKQAQKAEYQKQNTNNQETQLEMIKKLELSKSQHFELRDYAQSKNIKFLSTAFDLDSIDLLKDLGITLGKIPSGEITNYPYLVKMAMSFDKIILSTGMSSMKEIREAIDVLLENGRVLSDIIVLHCNTEYPTPMQDVNLLAMIGIKNELKVEIGYSDHTLGIEVPVSAVALGASVIEKHFTLDKTMEGPDHGASLNPGELKAMTLSIRNIEKALGNCEKVITKSEEKNIAIARKSIVAKEDIKKGDVFSADNLTVKRPGTGINPMKWKTILGLIAKKDFKSDDIIEI